jgi:hypothetical protein
MNHAPVDDYVVTHFSPSVLRSRDLNNISVVVLDLLKIFIEIGNSDADTFNILAPL